MSDLAGLSREELLARGQAQTARIAELTGELVRVNAAHAELSVAHEQLRTAYAELAAKVAKLEHLLSGNSGNSSMAPSLDDKPGGTAPKGKDRVTAKRARGKQPGAPGANLSWSDAPDERKDRFPHGVCGCGADLGEAADLGVVDAFQQIEIPTVTAALTQYDQHAVRCRCAKVDTAARPEGAGTGKVTYGPVLQGWAVFLMVVHHLPVHRCRQVLTALTGAEPSVGFVHALLARTAKVLREADARIRALITLVRVLCMDETPLRVGPKTPRPGRKKADKYLLIACTTLYTHFLLGDRDLDTFKASVLNDVMAGTVVVHDRYTLYDNKAFTGIVHQLCTQHLLRDLAGAGEVYPDAVWPAQIADALRALIHHANLARAGGEEQVDPDIRAELVKTLRHGVLIGLSDTTSHGTRPGEAKARALLEVFRDRPDDILRFTHDLNVPPTSNDAERGLRPSKIQQKISGRLTSIPRTQDRYRILGYLSTAAKHGLDQFTVLLDTFHGNIWIPDAVADT